MRRLRLGRRLALDEEIDCSAFHQFAFHAVAEARAQHGLEGRTNSFQPVQKSTPRMRGINWSATTASQAVGSSSNTDSASKIVYCGDVISWPVEADREHIRHVGLIVDDQHAFTPRAALAGAADMAERCRASFVTGR